MRTFGLMYDHTFFLRLQITRSGIRPHQKWAVSLVIAYGHFNLPWGFVWVCMGQYTRFSNPKGGYIETTGERESEQGGDT